MNGFSGYRVAWLSYLFWVQKLVGSNPATPIKNLIQSMLKTNFNAQKKSFKFFKSSLSCYGTSENRFFESELKKSHDQIILDFGHKHKVKVLSTTFKAKVPDAVVSKIKNFETPYNDMLVDFDAFRKIQTNEELFKLLKQKFESKSFLKGRVLNSTKRGFSVGICGVVGFLSINNVVKINKDKTVLVYIESMNANQGIITFSQKNIHKKTHKTLLKLASRIVFIFDSNSKKK